MVSEYIQAEDVQVTLFGMLDAAASQKGGALSAEEKESVTAEYKRLLRLSVASRFSGKDSGSMSDEDVTNAMRLRNAHIIRKAEEDYKLMHGMESTRSAVALNVFMETVPERYREASIADFNAGASIIQHILDKKASCLLTGPTGCGKTRLLYAVGKHLAPLHEPYAVVMDTLANLIARIHDSSVAEDWLSYAGEKYGRHTKVLIIDEFDKIKNSNSDYEILTHIINERYGHKLQTIVAGNGDIDSARRILGDAVVSRLTGKADGGRYFHQTGKDRRQ